MKKYAPYSFSKINCYNLCNRRFKYNYIDKIPREDVDTTALLKGGAVHSILEHYPNESPHKLSQKYQHIVDRFIETELGKKYIFKKSKREFKFGLTEELDPCGYYDKNAVFRGCVDFITIIDGVLHLIDWKTGKSKEIKWQDFSQLMFYAIYFFQKYPKIQKIKVSYVYVEDDVENDIILKREYLERYKKELNDLIEGIELDNKFSKNEGKLCKWCPFKSHCEKDL